MKIAIRTLTIWLSIALFYACGDDADLSDVLGNNDDNNDDIVDSSQPMPIEGALRKLLNKASDEPFTDVELATVARLVAIGRYPPGLIDFQDIALLMRLPNLTQLNLSRTHITDLRPLAGLLNLQQLSLSSNRITDLRPLACLVNLQKLDLQDNRIVDITPLKGLIQLEKLYLNSNRIVDLKPLVDNPGLVNENPVHLEGGFDIRADVVGVGDNPLSNFSRDEHIPALEARGVIVRQ